MTYDETIVMITQELQTLLDQKDISSVELSPETIILDTGLDSLDLATLIVLLEEKTGKDPFRSGCKNFTTLGELTTLYASS